MNVDPFIVPIPEKWRKDRELQPFLDYLVRWANDMWTRSGGGDDGIEEIKNGELYEPGTTDSKLTNLINQVDELELLLMNNSDSRINQLEFRIQELELEVALITPTNLTKLENRVSELETDIEVN